MSHVPHHRRLAVFAGMLLALLLGHVVSTLVRAEDTRGTVVTLPAGISHLRCWDGSTPFTRGTDQARCPDASTAMATATAVPPTNTPTAIPLTATPSPTATVAPTTIPTSTPSPTATPVPAVIYYVNAVNGNDSNTGRAVDNAWKTLAKANAAPLLPGESLRFKRGQVWTGQLTPKWGGTADKPITIGAYGTGNRPLFQVNANGTIRSATLVNVTGSYLIIDGLEARVLNPPIDAACQSQPYGWFAGFAVSGDHNVIRNNRASGLTVGVNLAPTANTNRVLANDITDNVVMSVNDTAPDNDSGAFGINVRGDSNEIAYNRFSGNVAWCSYDYGVDGAAIEIFATHNTNIHHNLSIDSRVFSELGGTSTKKASGTTYTNNVIVDTKYARSVFVNTRGAASSFGPTSGTVVRNNSVYLTGSSSTAIICTDGCTSDILRTEHNIIWSQGQAVWADAPFAESSNLFWKSDGKPVLRGITKNATSLIANPQYVNVPTDLHLLATSPALTWGAYGGTP